MDIDKIIQSGDGVMLIVSPDDLHRFAELLIMKLQEAIAAELEQQRSASQEERFLSKKEVKSLFGVCDTTLWSWHKNGLLRHRKFGKRIMYAYSDVKRFMDDHVDVETVSGYVKWHGKPQLPE